MMMFRFFYWCCFIFSIFFQAFAAAPKKSLPAAPAAQLIWIGDSITECYGLLPKECFVASLRQSPMLTADWELTIEGISGATTANMLERVQALTAKRVKWKALVVLLGGNDLMRGQTVAQVRANYQKLLDWCRQQHPDVKIFLFEAPFRHQQLTLGPRFRQWEQLYEQLEQKYKKQVTLFKDPFAGVFQPQLIQQDGIHPNGAGHQLLWKQWQPALEQWLNKINKLK
jgi:acyl-CoA thioesterase I